MAINLDQTNISPDDEAIKGLFADLQGNILASHGRTHSQHIFVKFNEGTQGEAKEWIRGFAQDYVTSAAQQAATAQRNRESFTQQGLDAQAFRTAQEEGRAPSGGVFGNFFLSSKGYEFLKIDPAPADNPRSFVNGMKNAGLNDPLVRKWEEGFRDDIHALILLADNNKGELDDAATKGTSDLEKIARTFAQIGKALRDEDGQVIEHFGYRDGLSQPLFLKSQIERVQQTDKWDPSAPLSLALVKDPNGRTEDSYGSYLVYRKLAQDVNGFNGAVQNLAIELGTDQNLAGALTVGRFKDGTPVVLSDNPDSEGTRPEDDFNYANDQQGARCPFQSHIRKTNPRGDTARNFNISFEDERRHRIARRAISYEMNGEVGLLFLCFQSNIGEQFEFMQATWANGAGFVKPGVGLDSLIGQGGTLGGQLWFKKWGVADSDPLQFDFSNFVTLKGGEYLFAPSISFLKNI